jgi:tripartite-type tricarboxylate transporter receptor subunit TctC
VKFISIIRTAAFGMFAALPFDASAQSYPNRPVTLVVGYSPGGPIDIMGRGLAAKFTELWQTQVIYLAGDPALTMNPYLHSKLAYDPEKDFRPISRVFTVNMGLIVRGDVPANDLKSFIALMKQRGDDFNSASTSVGSGTYIGMATIKQALGFKTPHLIYQGIAPAMQDMLGGSVHTLFAGFSAFAEHVPSGRVKVIAVSGSERWSALPQVATFAEQGYPDISVGFYTGLVAPAGTPDEVVRKVGEALRRVMADQSFIDRFIKPFDYRPHAETPQEFVKFLAEDRARSESRIRAANIQKLN